MKILVNCYRILFLIILVIEFSSDGFSGGVISGPVDISGVLTLDFTDFNGDVFSLDGQTYDLFEEIPNGEWDGVEIIGTKEFYIFISIYIYDHLYVNI